jgi:cytochrome c oxidase subunit 1
MITLAAQLVFLWNFFWSMFKGEAAQVNPWSCTTLEWTQAAPGGLKVNHGPYEYEEDGGFVMQDEMVH